MLPKSLFEIALALLIFLTTMSTITTMTTPTTMEGRVFVRVLANMHKGHNGGKCVMLNCKRFKKNDVQDAPQSTVAHRYRDDPKRRQRAPTPPLKRQAAGGGCSATSTRSTPAAAGKTSYAVIHISDSDELEVFEEENRGGGAPSSD